MAGLTDGENLLARGGTPGVGLPEAGCEKQGTRAARFIQFPLLQFRKSWASRSGLDRRAATVVVANVGSDNRPWLADGGAVFAGETIGCVANDLGDDEETT
ncbi:hypothetical protein H8A97_42280 [Bradyrhizobium sp. Arg62]|nr:hypothetical protein [Bradyrhizobium brasilense]MCC8951485.1 hypothetical protein [Bradyrhizobium brasilense]